MTTFSCLSVPLKPRLPIVTFFQQSDRSARLGSKLVQSFHTGFLCHGTEASFCSPWHPELQFWIKKIAGRRNNYLHSYGSMTKSPKFQSHLVGQCLLPVSEELSEILRHTSSHHGLHQKHGKRYPPHCHSDQHHTPGIPNPKKYIKHPEKEIGYIKSQIVSLGALNQAYQLLHCPSNGVVINKSWQ